MSKVGEESLFKLISQRSETGAYLREEHADPPLPTQNMSMYLAFPILIKKAPTTSGRRLAENMTNSRNARLKGGRTARREARQTLENLSRRVQGISPEKEMCASSPPLTLRRRERKPRPLSSRPHSPPRGREHFAMAALWPLNFRCRCR